MLTQEIEHRSLERFSEMIKIIEDISKKTKSEHISTGVV